MGLMLLWRCTGTYTLRTDSHSSPQLHSRSRGLCCWSRYNPQRQIQSVPIHQSVYDLGVSVSVSENGRPCRYQPGRLLVMSRMIVVCRGLGVPKNRWRVRDEMFSLPAMRFWNIKRAMRMQRSVIGAFVNRLESHCICVMHFFTGISSQQYVQCQYVLHICQHCFTGRQIGCK